MNSGSEPEGLQESVSLTTRRFVQCQDSFSHQMTALSQAAMKLDSVRADNIRFRRLAGR